MQPGMWPIGPWSYPDTRYYYDWWDADAKPPEIAPSDAEIKSTVVDRLKTNPRTADDDIRVDVKQHVVILGGEVSSWLTKRAAGDDAWDTPGVVDVSNQLVVNQSRA
jgi:osmotically-inducible protein OsmY